jgi:hypothetical protein
MHCIKYFFTILLVILLFPQLANSQVKSVTMKELATSADFIIVGKVTEMNSEWDEKKTHIFTRITLSVQECMKGDPSVQSIEIRQPGGEIGDVGEMYSHTPRFEDKEEVLLFVQKDRTNNMRVCRGINGKFPLRLNEVTKQIMINNQPINKVKEEINKILKFKNE